MGLFKKNPRRFVEEASFLRNRENQTRMAPATLDQLRQLGVTPDKTLKLEYFFYTDTPEKGAALASVLEGLGYSVVHEQAAGDPTLRVITGWTEPMRMSDETVIAWSGRMCEVGYEHDCEFDGWGTTPEQ
jgi:hypothetical protein